jgi:hypothetical protein
MRQTLTSQLGRAIGRTFCGRWLVDVVERIIGALLAGSGSIAVKLEPPRWRALGWWEQSMDGVEAPAAAEWREG